VAVAGEPVRRLAQRGPHVLGEVGLGLADVGAQADVRHVATGQDGGEREPGRQRRGHRVVDGQLLDPQRPRHVEDRQLGRHEVREQPGGLRVDGGQPGAVVAAEAERRDVEATGDLAAPEHGGGGELVLAARPALLAHDEDPRLVAGVGAGPGPQPGGAGGERAAGAVHQCVVGVGERAERTASAQDVGAAQDQAPHPTLCRPGLRPWSMSRPTASAVMGRAKW
jgi:hypothetical protein